MKDEVKYNMVPFTRGRGIHLGGKAYPHFISVKEQWDEQTDIHMDYDDLSIFADDSLDFVVISDLPENIDRAQNALYTAWDKVKAGGHMVLELESYPNIYDLAGYDLIHNQEFMEVFRKRTDSRITDLTEKKVEKTVCVVRYGGFGDMIQTSSILPYLQQEGYHVTVNTTPKGKEILQADPHIDDWLIQDRGQVPIGELLDYWAVIEKNYDRFINLSESVEGSVLAIDPRPQFYWPYSVRKKYLGTDLMEFTHDLAEVPMPPKFKWYPTELEKKWARKKRKGLKGPVIMWALSGSSVHKFYPYMDTIIARVLTTYPDVYFVLTGGYECKILEFGWQKEPRVITKSGEWTIRETLSFALECDLLLGPETGVIFAMGREKHLPKIITLSHSSVSNLYNHFRNTVCLIPEGCECYPCHKLHTSWETCNRATSPIHEDLQGAKCQIMISPDVMTKTINAYIDAARSKRVA